ncbi:uncharacterized protein LOC105685372 isoform X2 [Athalia rosae]|uniref:uncharacterized protein LOC105685372 isoform X2 n=1 Tax=Athalia rosae TaxID=37344 RepID=UPI002033A297|nr:uncharacterized protein LOC105685372 isoform X2 [Athalia rosae]
MKILEINFLAVLLASFLILLLAPANCQDEADQLTVEDGQQAAEVEGGQQAAEVEVGQQIAEVEETTKGTAEDEESVVPEGEEPNEGQDPGDSPTGKPPLFKFSTKTMNIIDAPIKACPPGQRRDSSGVCRLMLLF